MRRTSLYIPFGFRQNKEDKTLVSTKWAESEDESKAQSISRLRHVLPLKSTYNFLFIWISSFYFHSCRVALKWVYWKTHLFLNWLVIEWMRRTLLIHQKSHLIINFWRRISCRKMNLILLKALDSRGHGKSKFLYRRLHLSIIVWVQALIKMLRAKNLGTAWPSFFGVFFWRASGN